MPFDVSLALPRSAVPVYVRPLRVAHLGSEVALFKNKISRSWRIWHVVLVFVVCLSGCGDEREATDYTVRIHRMRCLSGFAVRNEFACNGASAEGGIEDFRLYPREG